MLTMLFYTTVCAEEKDEVNTTEFTEIQMSSNVNDYDNYIESIKTFKSAENDIVIDATNLSEGSTVKPITEELFGETNGVIFEIAGDRAVYTVDVTSDGIYNIMVNYAAIEKTTMDIQMTVYIDGEILWSGLEKVELFRWWKDATKKWNLDKEGNEVAPEQVESFGFKEQYLVDMSGLTTDYYQFYFSQGIHTIEFVLKQEPVAFKNITLSAPKELKNADKISASIKAVDYSGKDIEIQGEAAVEKSSFSLAPKSDGLSADVQPQSPYNNVINYIGSTTRIERGGMFGIRV